MLLADVIRVCSGHDENAMATLDHGIDVVCHSTTKSLNGHSDVIGGAIVTSDPELHESTMASHARHQAIDDRGANIAASSDPERLKCLHAHAAFELSMGDHPLVRRVLAEAAPRWCDDARCVSLA